MSELHPNVPIKPPFIYLAFLVVGGLMELIVSSWQGGLWPIFFGFILFGTGIYIGKLAFAELAKFKTTYKVKGTPVSTLVMSGPFSHTRNPIYICLSLMYLGLGLILSSLWILFLFPFLFIIMNVVVIEREERYLASQFGEDYLEYKKLVRRWV